MDAPLSHPVPARVDTQLVHAHGVAALVTLLIAVLFGIVASIQLLYPDLGASQPFLTWGRLRYSHTQGIMLGWLGNAFFAFMYHAVPLLTGRPVTSPRLGRWLFGLWNFAVMAPGWVLLLAGYSQPLEWAEFPLVIDVVVVVGLVLAVVQFIPPFFSRGLESLYVSSWYIIGALVFTLLAYPMGNVVPELVPGAAGAAFSGLWIHDAVGLFVTPLALAIIYFVIPAASGRPIYSHFLSMLGFWLLFFLYPLNGTHHYVFSVNSDGSADRRHHRVGASRRGRDHRRGQPAAVVARVGYCSARSGSSLRGDVHDLLSRGECSGVAAGADVD